MRIPVRQLKPIIGNGRIRVTVQLLYPPGAQPSLPIWQLLILIFEITPVRSISHVKSAIHFTDKLDILEREKEKAIKIYGNQANGLWWLEFRLG
ncbi:hypothetical protein AVEN_80875-1 [Araneus ventricosus]|uniref:Uncharacterized protein n=1 Tax=Araneus ventricosus TaxID=182803 RepID=A0A4Y2VDT2_ARAVE|nr:hypothetical protein AVEN_80875-1 [Araneus ventricosus]